MPDFFFFGAEEKRLPLLWRNCRAPHLQFGRCPSNIICWILSMPVCFLLLCLAGRIFFYMFFAIWHQKRLVIWSTRDGGGGKGADLWFHMVVRAPWLAKPGHRHRAPKDKGEIDWCSCWSLAWREQEQQYGDAVSSVLKLPSWRSGFRVNELQFVSGKLCINSNLLYKVQLDQSCWIWESVRPSQLQP